jgi:hypothetical protein
LLFVAVVVVVVAYVVVAVAVYTKYCAFGRNARSPSIKLFCLGIKIDVV